MLEKLFKRNKKILASIIAIELMRGIFLLAAAFYFTAFIGRADPSALLPLFLMLVLRVLTENLIAKRFLRLASTVRFDARRRLHREVFGHDAERIGTGELLTLFFDATASLEHFVIAVLPTLASLAILTPLILIVAAFVDPISAAIFLITLPIAPFLLRLIGKAIGDRNARAQAILIELNADFDELLRAIPTLKMFRRTEPALDRLRLISLRSTDAILDVLRLAFVSAFALELITTLAIALAAVVCGLRLTAGSIEFRAAFFILILAPEFFAPIRQLGAAFHAFVDAKQSFARLQTFLVEKQSPRRTIVQTMMPPTVTFKGVSFCYPQKKIAAVEGINISIEAGKITVLKGESGSGKSTLLKLMAGLLRPTAGEIFINDLPLSKADRCSIREKIAYVPQQPHRFNANFIDNAAVFNPIDPIKLKKFASELSLPIEDHKLSRGQLQRLGLLRALLKIERTGASIVILDEPTAGLDLETERLIVEEIKKIGCRRTIIIAAHRLAVLELADRIVDSDALSAVVHGVDGNVGNERDRIGVVGE